ncbi:hypothetical protein FE257_004610 [Aspergillus nanangensis]|uniref:Thiamine pyrophosphokinase n=1 Tax=Aspergillus nanangensis TaxID=2582783 RepID=A0AAD4GZI1_ASPNN|nr:hypothetical protein FE257_004610 [Aspergillus nanangensis]
MEWDPTQFFRDDKPPAPFALIILNQPINERAFGILNKHACMTVCADGGANHFYEMMKAHGKESTDLPSLILGDLDSIHPSIKTHYTNLQVPIIHDADQYSTDFTKCLNYLRSHAHDLMRPSFSSSLTAHSPTTQSSPNSTTTTTTTLTRLEILILGGLGGRVDQAFSQIHHLYLMQQQPTLLPGDLYLISEESITMVLQPGKNVIHTPCTNRPLPSSGDDDDGDRGSVVVSSSDEHLHLLEENVGIIPLSGPERITTSGFQWDVEDWPTAIGGQLSTSNHIRADVVTVEAKGPVLFTVELARRFKRVR